MKIKIATGNWQLATGSQQPVAINHEKQLTIY